LFYYFINHPFVRFASIVVASFTAGFGANQVLSDHFDKVESLERGRLSTDVATLQQEVLSRSETIQTLEAELSKARENIVILQNRQGSSNLSCQDTNQKYSSLSQDYSQLSGMYRSLQANYQKAQQNCNALTRINFLEEKRRSLENQLSSVSHDVFNRDPESKKLGIQLLLSQNHEQLLNLQQHLSR
jgi:chromosome segregation ATPase